jgi:tetratricopeptide (TPR) repeat protein
MKNLALTVVLSFITIISFGQKKAVNEAKNEIKSANPNIGEARNFIKEALKDPETANLAETWYVAGSIEDKQFSLENVKNLRPGGAPDDKVMYTALDAIYPYFEKAYELDNLPNEKGKIKPKYSKDIKSIMKINRDNYINSALYFFDAKNWKKSYENFKLYLDMPNLPMMAGEKWTDQRPDTFYAQIKFYTALAASQIPDHQIAIDLLTSIKEGQYREIDVYKQLSSEYNEIGDSVMVLSLLKEGVTKFPGDEYFMMNLIERSIQAGLLPDAIDYIQVAIDQSPDDVVMHDVLGVIYELSNDFDKAIVAYEKALEIDPTYTKALKHVGMYHYNKGVKIRAAADDIHDKKQYDIAYAQSLESYKAAIPFLEKAFNADPKDTDVIFCLRASYYNLGMGEKFEEMDALYTKGVE